MSQTIEEVLNRARLQLAPVSESPGLDAQVLLSEIMGKDRAYLLAHPEQILSDDQDERFRVWVGRRAEGEPVAYIIGRRAFYDRDIIVAPGVLIPRPETELLLEQALEFVKRRSKATVVDVGTGSGALAVTLAAHCPQATVYAVDVSPQALEIARLNALRNQTVLEFFEGDLLEPLIARRISVDLVVANLPYIPTGELASLVVSKFEPSLALDGGPDGLDLIRRLLSQIPTVCAAGALVLLEIGADQGNAVSELVREQLSPRSVQVLQDYAGLERIVKIEW